ncbi:hypothetical protein K438DRAFT_1656768 [Mycena galopus ATCC 62051]|nr:hypothetical protein K438DRAFT_1656768 [Mycena galopus ATCC 62051]
MFRTPSVSVEIHSLEDFPTFPPEISNVCARLDSPLPSWCISGPYPFVSDGALLLLPELARIPQTESCDSAQQGLGDVFDLVLSTVLDVRSVGSHYGPSRSVVPFLSSLMRSLAYICANEVVIIPGATFVRPRTAKLRSLAFNGIATMLACHCLKDFETDHSACASEDAVVVTPTSCLPDFVDAIPPASLGACAVSPAPSASSHASSSSSSPISSSPASSSSSSSAASEPSVSSSSASSSRRLGSDIGHFFGHKLYGLDMAPTRGHFFNRSVDVESTDDDSSSIDAPLHPHILPGRHPCAILPFFCLADTDNIFDLVISVACQRYVWGVSQPIVGFALEKSGSILKLVIGWVDPDTRIAHIASPATDAGDTVAGVFDFSNAAAALSFAQFVLNLSDDVATILKHTRAGCENNRLDWRSDNLLSQDFVPSLERVNRWVHDVDISLRNPSRPPTPPPSNPSEKAMSSEPKRTRSTTKSTQKWDKLLEPTSSKQAKAATGSETTVQTGSENETAKSTDSQRAASQKRTKGKASLASKSYKSSSTFADLPAYGFSEEDKEEGNILTWTFYRRVYLCGLIKLEDKDDNSREINGKIESYHKMCQFLRPPWNMNDHPHVPPYLEKFLTALLNYAVDVRKAGSPSTDDDVLSAKHQAIIGDRLSTLFSASIGAFTLHRRTVPSVKEAESRHEWDALFYRFYVENHSSSPHILLERTIHFPRNETADQLKESTIDDVIAGQIKQATDYRRLCASAYVMADSSEVRGQALIALNQADTLSNTLETHTQSAQHFRTFVDNHSHQEPRDGICDGILFMAIRPPPAVNSKSLLAQTQFIRPSSNPVYEPGIIKLSPEMIQIRDTLHNPFRTRTNKPAPVEVISPPQEIPPPEEILGVDEVDFDGLILLPHAPVEYKKPSEELGKALNQGRMYLVSVVAFYSAIGIEDHAFYSVVTSGRLGAVIMAWKSSTSKIIYLMDRNVTVFDISIPVEAFHFATFLLRLHDDRADLVKRVEELINKEDFDFQVLNRWRKSVQDPKPPPQPKKTDIGEEKDTKEEEENENENENEEEVEVVAK